jgi:hypothetical protein
LYTSASTKPASFKKLQHEKRNKNDGAAYADELKQRCRALTLSATKPNKNKSSGLAAYNKCRLVVLPGERALGFVLLPVGVAHA